MLNYAMWGQGVLYIIHKKMKCLGSMLNDAMWGQGVLYYASGNKMFTGKIHKDNRSKIEIIKTLRLKINSTHYITLNR